MKFLFITFLILASTFAQAETCFSYLTLESSNSGKSAYADSLKSISPDLITPEMKKMMANLDTSSGPRKVQVYMSGRYFVQVMDGGWQVFDFDTMNVTHVDPATKIYQVFSISELLKKMNIAGLAKSAGTKKTSTWSKPEFTGVKSKVSGIECNQYKSELHIPGNAAFSSTLKCINDKKPEAFFVVRKVQDEKLEKALPADLKAKLISLQQQGNSEAPLIEGLSLGNSGEYWDGFALQENSTTNDSNDPKTKKTLASIRQDSIKTVEKMGTVCPEDRYVKIPAGYKKMDLSEILSGTMPDASTMDQLDQQMKEIDK